MHAADMLLQALVIFALLTYHCCSTAEEFSLLGPKGEIPDIKADRDEDMKSPSENPSYLPNQLYQFLGKVNQTFNGSEFVPFDPISGPLLKSRRIGLAFQPEQCLSFRRLPEYSTPTRNVFSVESGDNLNITCMTIQPHRWRSNAPLFEGNVELKNLTQTYSSLSEIHGLQFQSDIDYSRFRFYDTLMLTNLSHLHVGEYACSSFGSIKLTERLFLFVKDQDHPVSSPRKQGATHLLNATLGSDTVIPCLPAHPQFDVSLYKENTLLGDKYDFHPLKGFIIPNVTSLSLAGDYQCRFTSYHRFEQIRSFRLKVAEKTLLREVSRDNETPKTSSAFLCQDRLSYLLLSLGASIINVGVHILQIK
ncbi:uncharacterized protein LOC131877251 [Tigriopus californicus]|uniref:uncharacterized protein LOC131877251 n=1 Tax=Tigriopus californicus TaxID=6832 RepID=UPI0027DA6F6B|nr:uncharacterized protein LOC131877251 [Tigriopus californicus]